MKRVYGGSSDGFCIYDPALGCEITRIHAGGYCVVQGEGIISTLLGSCVAVCLWDPKAQIAGMNHYVLPWLEDSSDYRVGRSGVSEEPVDGDCRFGSHAMSSLIDTMLLMGAHMRRLRAKVFGGGVMLSDVHDIGAENIRFADETLRTLGIPISARDVGGRERRVIRLFSRDGKVLVCRGEGAPREMREEFGLSDASTGRAH